MNFVSCDWGTTNFRLRLVGGTAAAEVRTDDGAAKLAALGGDRADAFRRVLASGLEQLGAGKDLPVVISGMASSTIGWRELPYARLPFALDGKDVVWERLAGGEILISGFRSDADMLRGEETQAIGLYSSLGSERAGKMVMVLPGTHSKHLTVESGMVTGLRTFMTGELFDLLSRQSVLRHTVDPMAALDPDAFAAGVRELERSPLTGALFRVRTRQVLDGKTGAANSSFLSGLLIGAELTELRSVETPVVVAAGTATKRAYALAGEVLGLGDRLKLVDSEPLTALGQAVILRRLLSDSADQNSSPAEPTP